MTNITEPSLQALTGALDLLDKAMSKPKEYYCSCGQVISKGEIYCEECTELMFDDNEKGYTDGNT